MKKNYTHKLCKSVDNGREVVAPAKSTLDFLKQFARTYYAEKSLPRSLNEFCVN